MTSPCSKQRLTMVRSMRKQSPIVIVAARRSCDRVTHIISGERLRMISRVFPANSLVSAESDAMSSVMEFLEKCCSIDSRMPARRLFAGSACEAKGAAKRVMSSRRLSADEAMTSACNAGNSAAGTKTSASPAYSASLAPIISPVTPR